MILEVLLLIIFILAPVVISYVTDTDDRPVFRGVPCAPGSGAPAVRGRIQGRARVHLLRLLLHR